MAPSTNWRVTRSAIRSGRALWSPSRLRTVQATSSTPARSAPRKREMTGKADRRPKERRNDPACGCDRPLRALDLGDRVASGAQAEQPIMLEAVHAEGVSCRVDLAHHVRVRDDLVPQ